VGRQSSLTEQISKELAAFQAESEAVLARPTGDLPDDVFKHPNSNDRPSR
jgi:hypothetical protein